MATILIMIGSFLKNLANVVNHNVPEYVTQETLLPNLIHMESEVETEIGQNDGTRKVKMVRRFSISSSS